MRNKHFLSLMMAAALVVCTSFTSGTTNAAELDENTGDQTVTINYTVNSTWSVTVPATITIPSSKIAEYEITAEGSITNDEAIHVKTSGETIVLNEVDGTNTLTAEFRNTSDGVATKEIGVFDNANTSGNNTGELTGNKTLNQTITRYIAITNETIPAGTYQVTCTFTANLQ